MVNITAITQNQELCYTTTIPALDNSSSLDSLVPKTFTLYPSVPSLKISDWGTYFMDANPPLPGLTMTRCHPAHVFNVFTWNSPHNWGTQTRQCRKCLMHKPCSFSLHRPTRSAVSTYVLQKGKGCQSRRSPLEPRDTHLWEEELKCERRFISTAL